MDESQPEPTPEKGSEPPPTLKRDVAPSLVGQPTQINLANYEEVQPEVPFVASYPDQLGEYELLEELARGGMGVVFKARHVRLQRIVALKMILHGHVDDNNRERFHLEATATAQLQHPGIVAIYEVDSHDGQPFFTMEFVDGSSLAQRVESGPLPSLVAASYLEKTARAVHFAHTKGILHRDLKPANVLLDEHDQPKVTDFGLAKVLQHDSKQTRTGAIMGTPSYMAPEQAKAWKNLGPACDVYSLGAILYELLTGRPPFQGETALATMTLVIEQEPVPPRLLNPKVDRDLETICLKCLEKETSRRYLSAEVLASDLRNYLDGRPIHARRLGALARGWKWCRRKPTAAALVAVSAAASLALLAGGVGFGIVQHNALLRESDLRADADREARRARAAEEAARKAEKEARVQNEASRHLLYVAQYRLARNAWESGNTRRALDWLLPWQQTLKDKRDPRGWEWHFLQGLCDGKFALQVPNARVTALAFRADSQLLATADDTGNVRLWDIATGQLVRTLRVHDYAVWALAFSPNGRLLATIAGDKADRPGEVKIWDLFTGKETPLPGKFYHVVIFSPDGRVLATAADDQVKLWDAKTLQPVRSWKGHDGPVHALAFRADSRRLAAAGEVLKSKTGVVTVWDVEGDAERLILNQSPPRPPLPRGGVFAVAFVKVPEGSSDRLLTASADQTARLWDIDKARELTVLPLPASGNVAVALSPDGTQLATCSPESLVAIWKTRGDKLVLDSESRWYVQAVSTPLFPPFGRGGGGGSLAFSPDGQRLACAGGDGLVWLGHSVGGQEALGLEGHTHSIHALAFNRDGGRLVSASDDGFRLWDPALGTLLPSLKRLTGVTAAVFSPSGQLLALAGRDATVRLYNADGTRELAVLHGHEKPVRALAFSRDGKLLASAGDDAVIRLWNPLTGDPLGTLTGHASGVVALAFSPRSNVLASAASGDDVIHLWDPHSKESRGVLKGHANGVVALAFSPGGQRLASGSFDKAIRLWDLERGREPFILEGHGKVVNSISFSPDGTRLVSGSGDHTVRVWDTVTRQELLKLDGGAREVICVAFSPDGRRLAAGGHDRIVRVWEAVVGGKK